MDTSELGADITARGPAVCLFAQHNAAPAIPPPVWHYWAALRAAGFRVHAALSGKEEVAAGDRARMAALGIAAIPRPNAGLDFGAWSDLLARGLADGAADVLLANDSVLGPFTPLAPIVRRMAGYDAWGMVMSREGRPHLQSWFVMMSAAALGHPAVRRVFAQPFAAMGKEEVVVHGELGLGAALSAAGLDVGAVVRRDFRLRPSRVIATNPMHFGWREMLDAGVPFLKRELIERNPSRIIGAADWRAELRRRGWDAPWLDGVTDAAPGRRLGLRQAGLQLAVREGRWRLLRAAIAGA